MSVKPILFNTEMVRAILDGRKTVTRRPLKFLNGRNPNWTGYIKDGLILYNGKNEPCCKRPPYQPGDILYVRERFCKVYSAIGEDYIYYADKPDDVIAKFENGEKVKWKPSIHMPQQAARIWLKVTDVRVERLQDITPQAAWEEGARCNCLHPVPDCAGNKKEFAKIWDSTIKKKDLDKYGWDANPWVWVIKFERTVNP